MLGYQIKRYGIRLIILLFILTATFHCSPVKIQAQETLDLEIGGEGSTSWSFT